VAITGLEYVVFSSLRAHHIFPAKPAVLELGESNWYGDVPVNQLTKDLDELVADPDKRRHLAEQLQESAAANRPNILYEIARIFFQAVFDPISYTAIDPGTPSSQHQFDLNEPVPMDEQFDITMNIGTAEHIFNVYQFFKTAHERTLPGGLMIHTSPFTGWPDHGFYNFQPTFFFDLSRANRYEILSMVCAQFQPLRYVQIPNHDEFGLLLKAGKIPQNSHLNVVYRKPMEPAAFAVPTQGYYAGALSPEMARLWRELR
jgi:hypothetical protein